MTKARGVNNTLAIKMRIKCLGYKGTFVRAVTPLTRVAQGPGGQHLHNTIVHVRIYAHIKYLSTAMNVLCGLT